MEYTIRKNSEETPYEVVMNDDPSFRVSIYELTPREWNSKEKKVYGINWFGCGTLPTKTGRDYAKLIMIASDIADKLNS